MACVSRLFVISEYLAVAFDTVVGSSMSLPKLPKEGVVSIIFHYY